MQPRGFTLLELLSSLVIISVMLVIAIPSFSSQIQQSNLKTTTLTLLEDIATARSKAVFTNKRVVIKNTGSWENGWEIFVDYNNNGIKDGNETILHSQQKLKDIRITPNKPLKKYISFIGSGESRFAGVANGGGLQMGTFTICAAKSGQGYSLTLSSNGRIRMNEIEASKCNKP